MGIISEKVEELVTYISEVRKQNPEATKNDLYNLCISEFDLKKGNRGTLLFSDYYAIRFNEAGKARGFSNTIAGIKRVKEAEDSPLIVVIIRPQTVEVLIANSTFIRKISHSSNGFAFDNIKGSFQGADIMMEYEGLKNKLGNFDALFRIHKTIPWEDNLHRLVETTTGIVPRISRFTPTAEQINAITKSPALALKVLESKEFEEKSRRLHELVKRHEKKILQFAEIDNVNIRGNKIEQVLTGDINRHDLGDLVETLPNDIELIIDIKSKLFGRNSNPKAYNIDKMLKSLSKGNTVFVFLFIGIDVGENIVIPSIISMFDRHLILHTTPNDAWAGRSTRGATQISNLDRLFNTKFKKVIDVGKAQKFLHGLLERQPAH